QDSITEIMVVKGGKPLFSITCSMDAPEDDKRMMAAVIKDRFPGIYHAGTRNKGDEFQDAALMNLPDTSLTWENYLSGWIDGDKLDFNSGGRKFKKFPPLGANRASASLMPFILGKQQISLDYQPVKIKIFRPFKYILPLLAVLLAGLYLFTEKVNDSLMDAQSNLTTVRTQVKNLEGELFPLQEKIETLKRASRFKNDVDIFMQSRPPLFTALNEIARQIPDGTWFSTLTFNENKLVLRGIGADALRIVELLRASDMFRDVSLRGSVNRRNTGDEQFMVNIELNPDYHVDIQGDAR
ncbi:MAG: PilN domain-containing protein, partial [Desulfamplus sp.]|nr:PilN domain-containing protein [Desulfamplus sp.]